MTPYAYYLLSIVTFVEMSAHVFDIDTIKRPTMRKIVFKVDMNTLPDDFDQYPMEYISTLDKLLSGKLEETDHIVAVERTQGMWEV